MGLIYPSAYRRLNKITKLWEWVYPEPEQYNKADKCRSINVKTPKKKRKR